MTDKYDSLDSALKRCDVLKNLVAHAQDRIKGDPKGDFAKNVLEIAPAYESKKKRDNLEFMRTVGQKVEEAAVLEIISEFEKLAFREVSKGSNSLQALAEKGYSKEDPFCKIARGFIKTDEDIGNLRGIRKILEITKNKELDADLKELADYRNFLAHGKRFKRPAKDISPKEAYEKAYRILKGISIK